jgi:hypothetical protein
MSFLIVLVTWMLLALACWTLFGAAWLVGKVRSYL